MKPEQQRIAIAEACGWKRLRTVEHQNINGKDYLKIIVGSITIF